MFQEHVFLSFVGERDVEDCVVFGSVAGGVMTSIVWIELNNSVEYEIPDIFWEFMLFILSLDTMILARPLHHAKNTLLAKFFLTVDSTRCLFH